MGTHPSMPSKARDGTPLSDILKSQPELVDESIRKTFNGTDLPFLFKILSVNKALSIQAHPDKLRARIAYLEDPKNYKDDNHKPEMVIALTPFHGFCGFRPPKEIATFLDLVPEFRELVGGQFASEFIQATQGKVDKSYMKRFLKVLFANMMNAPEKKVGSLAEQLIRRAKSERERFGGESGGLEFSELLITLNTQFPCDVGLFCALVLNWVKLNTGEVMFLQANEPHAYLSGGMFLFKIQF
jgi:mannose-6-phosphate isomerase